MCSLINISKLLECFNFRIDIVNYLFINALCIHLSAIKMGTLFVMFIFFYLDHRTGYRIQLACDNYFSSGLVSNINSNEICEAFF